MKNIKALDLLKQLDSTITTINLDMGGKHRYTLSHKSHTVITEIKGFLYDMDREHRTDQDDAR